MVTITVCKDNQAYVRLYGTNNTDSTIKASDSQMIMHDAGLGLPLEMFSHVYYCKGVRGDGEELTYDYIKEIFPEDIYKVRESNDSSGKEVIVYSVSFAGGASSLDFYINTEDGTCFRVMEKSLY